MPSVDWMATSTVMAAIVALLGAALSYGVLRQKVTELTTRANQQDNRLDTLVAAIDTAKSVAGEVQLLRQSAEAANNLAVAKQEGAHALLSQRMEGLTGEIRAFMQGQAAAGQQQQQQQPSAQPSGRARGAKTS